MNGKENLEIPFQTCAQAKMHQELDISSSGTAENKGGSMDVLKAITKVFGENGAPENQRFLTAFRTADECTFSGI